LLGGNNGVAVIDCAEIVAAVRAVAGEGNLALHEPLFEGREAEYVNDCVATGWVSGIGSYVDRFEAELARLCEVNYAVAVSSGTAALHIALLLAGVKRDDEVIVPAITFVATANAVSHCGAVPHIAECEEATLGLDAAKLDAYLGSICAAGKDGAVNKQTGRTIRAVVPVHVLGHPANMDAIEATAAHYGLAVVADAAEALGSHWHGRPVAARGRLSTLSFNGNKLVVTGGGGAVLTDDRDLAHMAKDLTTTAKVPHPWEYEHRCVAYNYRLPNLNAALGCAQLERLDDFISRKRRLAAHYRAAFEAINGVSVINEPEGAQSNYWLNGIALESAMAGQRDSVLQGLTDDGIFSRPLWTPLHRQPPYRGSPRMPVDVADSLTARVITLPSSVALAPAA
jgi:perosamine synthetase